MHGRLLRPGIETEAGVDILLEDSVVGEMMTSDIPGIASRPNGEPYEPNDSDRARAGPPSADRSDHLVEPRKILLPEERANLTAEFTRQHAKKTNLAVQEDDTFVIALAPELQRQLSPTRPRSKGPVVRNDNPCAGDNGRREKMAWEKEDEAAVIAPAADFEMSSPSPASRAVEVGKQNANAGPPQANLHQAHLANTNELAAREPSTGHPEPSSLLFGGSQVEKRADREIQEQLAAGEHAVLANLVQLQQFDNLTLSDQPNHPKESTDNMVLDKKPMMAEPISIDVSDGTKLNEPRRLERQNSSHNSLSPLVDLTAESIVS
ncbi:hypothetical protein HDV05_007601, partial [Chytridiales sp. JEL 0842]